ncbi:DUF6174 domain-containing protein [Rubrivirga sp.]|uniref:DUF6174 domain-containing protein n=1 Tax=Rubrivirga sp. TaxID=1885344 RepID=UPI003B524960
MRAFPLVLLLVAAGCDSDSVGGDVDLSADAEVTSAEDLARARAEWADAGPDRYRMSYEVLCFCPPNTVEVLVEDGRVVASSATSYETEPLGVLGLYDVALDAYAAGAASVTVRVTERGPPVPVQVSIDYDEGLADEEIGYRVVSFRAE